jgi:hypothetical protein
MLMTFWVAFETILETVSEADPPRKGPRWAHAGHQARASKPPKKSCMFKQKPETTDSFRRFLGSGDLTGEPSEAQKERKAPKRHPKNSKALKKEFKIDSIVFAKYERILGAILGQESSPKLVLYLNSFLD